MRMSIEKMSLSVRSIGLAAFVFAAAAVPARADTITIDSTNCSSTGGCYGLAWTLTINTVSIVYGGVTYGYQALLSVTDDPAVSGTPNIIISAVDFKVSSSVSGAALYTVPSSTSLSTWSTVLNNLNSNGCTTPGGGFVCSDSATDPANFLASATAQTWGWYFNTSDPIFSLLNGAHIGAKLTNLSRPGRLLSATHTVPEPSSLSLLGAAGVAMVLARYRRRRQSH